MPRDPESRQGGAYEVLAPIYDAWQEAAGTPFFRLVLPRLERSLASRVRDTRVFSFADLGCGTGGLLQALRSAHPAWRLCGVDASVAMLDRARRGPASETIMWRQGHLESCLPPGSVDAAGCFFDTLNHLVDLAALRRACAAVAAALRPGGLFVFDVTNRIGFERWWRSHNQWSDVGWSLAVTTTFDGAAGRARASASITRGREHIDTEIIERCFSDAELRAALGAAGLAVESVEPWSPFALDEPGKSWWVARAP